MSDRNDEQKNMEQAAWITLVLIAILALICVCGVLDALVFDGMFFGSG